MSHHLKLIWNGIISLKLIKSNYNGSKQVLPCLIVALPHQRAIGMWGRQAFQNFDQNIECIEYSKHQGTKKRWSYHLICTRKHIYRVFLKEFSNLFKCLTSNDIHTVTRWFDLLFKALHWERKRKKGENSHKACMGTFNCYRSPPIYRHLICRFFIKPL